jgi:hypothetical protein
MLSGQRGENNTAKYFLKRKENIYRDKNNDNNLKAGIYLYLPLNFNILAKEIFFSSISEDLSVVTRKKEKSIYCFCFPLSFYTIVLFSHAILDTQYAIRILSILVDKENTIIL